MKVFLRERFIENKNKKVGRCKPKVEKKGKMLVFTKGKKGKVLVFTGRR